MHICYALTVPPTPPGPLRVPLSLPLPPQPAAAKDKKKKKSAAAQLPREKAAAVELVKDLYMSWQAPMETLGRAGRAFEGLEALLGGAGFELEGNIWKRQVCVEGWGRTSQPTSCPPSQPTNTSATCNKMPNHQPTN